MSNLKGKDLISNKEEFSKLLLKLDSEMKYKVSSRGWCYILENLNLITKAEFDLGTKKINILRKKTKYLPIDFVASDKARKFYFVDDLNGVSEDPKDYLISWLNSVKEIHTFKDDINFWKTQEYYIQMMVEKVDLVGAFSPLCKKYRIPLASTKGEPDLNSRLILARRFKEAEDIGLKCIFLYYGDFDPGGFRISDFLKKHVIDVEKDSNYDATNLTVERVGLNEQFIIDNKIQWINNLISSKGKDIWQCYQHYLKTGEKYRTTKKGKRILNTKIDKNEIAYCKKYGERKMEALAILPEVIMKEAVKDLENTIEKYLGKNPFQEYNRKSKESQDEVEKISNKIQLKAIVDDLIEKINKI